MTNPSKPKENRGSRHEPPTNAFPVGGPGGPGRPKLTEEEKAARAAVKAFQPEAISLLIGHARNIEDARLSLDAIKHLTSWLPKLQLEVTGADGGPVQTLAIDPSKLTTSQLDAILSAIPASSDRDD